MIRILSAAAMLLAATPLAAEGPASSWTFSTGSGWEGEWCTAKVEGRSMRGKDGAEIDVSYGEASVSVGVVLGQPVDGLDLVVRTASRQLIRERLQAMSPDYPNHAALRWGERTDAVIAALRRGELATVKEKNGDVLYAFSLRNSNATIGEVLACFARRCTVLKNGSTFCR